jgi:hypothetical protein
MQGTAFGHAKVRGKKLLIQGLNTLPFQWRFSRVPGAAFTMHSFAACAAAADARPARHRQDRPLWRKLMMLSCEIAMASLSPNHSEVVVATMPPNHSEVVLAGLDPNHAEVVLTGINPNHSEVVLAAPAG